MQEGPKLSEPANRAPPSDGRSPAAGTGASMASSHLRPSPPTEQASAPPPRSDGAPPAESARAESTPATPSGGAGAFTGLSRATLETTAMVAAQIVRRLEARSTRFEMALTPEGLGRVDVSMEIDAEGRLAARLAFDNPAAAAELRGRVDDLRRQLEASGFQIGDDALEFGEREGGRDQPFDRSFGDRRPGGAFDRADRLNDDPSSAAAPTRWTALTLTPERVDMKV